MANSPACTHDRVCSLACTAVQVTIVIQAEDDPPVAEDMDLTLYSGRNTTFSLAAYDPDGSPIEVYILKEPQGGASILKLAEESTVSVNGLRRKVGCGRARHTSRSRCCHAMPGPTTL